VINTTFTTGYAVYTSATSISTTNFMITQGWLSGNPQNLSPVTLTWTSNAGNWQLNAGIFNSSNASFNSTFTVYYYYQ
jgi:hypothetical protein